MGGWEDLKGGSCVGNAGRRVGSMRRAEVEYSLGCGEIFDVSVLEVGWRVGVVLQAGSFIFILGGVFQTVGSEQSLGPLE